MEKFSEIVFTVLPYALGFIALVGLAILVLHLRLKHIESQPKEVITVDGTGTDDSNGRSHNSR